MGEDMDIERFLFALSALALGSGGVGFTLLRAVGGKVPRWKVWADSLASLGTVALGFFLLTDGRVFMAIAIAAITGGGIVHARNKGRHVDSRTTS
jgi:hypothetical protein